MFFTYLYLRLAAAGHHYKLIPLEAKTYPALAVLLTTHFSVAFFCCCCLIVANAATSRGNKQNQI